MSRLKQEEGAVPSAVAEAHRKALNDIDDLVRREQQVYVYRYIDSLRENLRSWIAKVFIRISSKALHVQTNLARAVATLYKALTRVTISKSGCFSYSGRSYR